MKKFFSVLFITLVASTSYAVKVETLKTDLFTVPNYQWNGSCDIGIHMGMESTKVLGDIIVLESFVQGTCEIAIIDNKRAFEVTETGTSCGSLVYKGHFFGKRNHKIEVMNHTTRLCKDLVPAKIVVKETDDQGREFNYYSAN